MPHSATAYRLLISAPGDVPEADILAVTLAINRWNAIYGRNFAAVVVSLHWNQHSAAEHGVRPQESLNAQLVDEADIVIALFWHRLGSSTGEAESGTVEELEKAHREGAYVAVLRSARDIPSSDFDSDQVQALEAFLGRIKDESLILQYADEGELARHVEAILTRAVSQSGARAEAVAEPATQAEVYPRIERHQRIETDTRGRQRTRNQWTLVLANTGNEPAEHVRYRLEPEEEGDNLPIDRGDGRELEALSPGGEATYGLLMHSGVTSQARCVVTWEDSTGEHETRATLRFY